MTDCLVSGLALFFGDDADDKAAFIGVIGATCTCIGIGAGGGGGGGGAGGGGGGALSLEADEAIDTLGADDIGTDI